MADLYSFLPDGLADVFVTVTGLFVGKGWHLTLGDVHVGRFSCQVASWKG